MNTEHLVAEFEAHTLDPADFRHAQHVQLAHARLLKYDFVDATTIYANGIRTIAAKHGAGDKFNVTITYAFLGLIAQRMAKSTATTHADFVAKNPDLLSKDLLTQWYTDAQLNSDTARTLFLMPTAQAR